MVEIRESQSGQEKEMSPHNVTVKCSRCGVVLEELTKYDFVWIELEVPFCKCDEEKKE